MNDIVEAEVSFEPAPEAPRVWGFWATIGLTLAVLSMNFMAQIAVTIAAVVFHTIRDPHAHVQAWAAELATNGLYLSLCYLLATPLCLGLVAVFVKIRQGMTLGDYLALEPVKLVTLLIWLCRTGLYIFASDGLTYSLERPIVPEFMTAAYETAVYPPLLWLTIIVLAPLLEETLFRGFMLPGIVRTRLGAAGAIALTSLLWAAIHVQYDAYGIASVFVLGILLGLARIKTASLYVPLAMHVFANLVATHECV